MTTIETTMRANLAVKVYRKALEYKPDDNEAYIKGVDYIIDHLFDGDVLGKNTLRTIRAFDRKLGLPTAS